MLRSSLFVRVLLVHVVGLGAACGAGATVPPAASPSPAPVDVAQAAADILALQPRLAMPIDGLPCEGPSDALLTIVEYVGYQCRFTRRLQPTVERLLREHRGEVRLCIRQVVIAADQPHGTLAAAAAIETFRLEGSEAFFRLHRAMLGQDLTPDRIRDLAIESGVDESELRHAIDVGAWRAQLAEDAWLVRRIELGGTPDLFIAAKELGGARPYEEIDPLVLDALSEARALVAVGVPRSELYDAIQRVAVTEVARPEPRPGEPARVRIRFIDVPTSSHPLATEPRTLDEARTIAERLAEEIRGGADFGDLARRWSAASNAARGGEFGWLRPGTLTEETEDVALHLGIMEVGTNCDPRGHTCRVIQRLE